MTEKDKTKNMVQEHVSGIATPKEVDPMGMGTTGSEEQAYIDAEAQRAAMLAELDIPRLKKAFKFAAVAALSLTFILIIAIPLPLFFSSHGEYLSSRRVSKYCGTA
jgi:hypothetical protein